CGSVDKNMWAIMVLYYFVVSYFGSHKNGMSFLCMELFSSNMLLAFLVNFLQHKKCIKDPVEIHHIKQREEESTEDFMKRFKTETRHVNGASECMRISGFMHEITNSKLIKHLHENIPRSVDKMMRVTTTFLRGELAASSKYERKYFWRGSNRKLGENKISKEREISRINKDQSGDGCGAFNLYMDEFCGGKITIFIQWDHKKAKGKENSSSPVNSSWNVKLPSSRRNTHSTEQQDNPTQMYNGLRTRSTAFLYHPSCRIEDQSSNSSRIPRANNCNTLYPDRGRKKGVVRSTQTRKRSQALERNKAIQKEVAKLVDAGIIKEVHYHSWLSNPVMVKKHDDSWRMCVDFKDLNKACLKDGYPLLEIDWKVESL
nr:reverse transcriptase domain-containing protein [Tanacetum cinerariifolium]